LTDFLDLRIELFATEERPEARDDLFLVLEAAADLTFLALFLRGDIVFTAFGVVTSFLGEDLREDGFLTFCDES